MFSIPSQPFVPRVDELGGGPNLVQLLRLRNRDESSEGLADVFVLEDGREEEDVGSRKPLWLSFVVRPGRRRGLERIGKNFGFHSAVLPTKKIQRKEEPRQGQTLLIPKSGLEEQ